MHGLGWGSARAAVSTTAAIVLAVGVVVAGPSAAEAAVSGVAWTVGAGINGQLGTGSTANRTSFGSVPGLSDVVQVSGGREHVLALDGSGHVFAWGDGPMGQLGYGGTADKLSPTQVPGISTAVAIAAGHYHSLALLADGTVRAWGYNSFGQLGDGTVTNRTSPVVVSGLTNVVEISGGRDLSMALKDDGTVWAWGSDVNGELGDGSHTNRSTPVRVDSLTSVVHIATGRNHGIALKSDGTVWTWGLNASGQLGNGTKVSVALPVRATGISTAVEVAAGADDSLALLADGSVQSWGEGGRGQLGSGSTTDRTVPAAVGGLPAIASLDSGRDHTLAVTTSGQLWDWGFDDAGQLGDGSTANHLTPQRIAGIDDAVEASGGRNYTVLLRSSSGPPDTVPPTVPGQPSGTSTVAGRIDLTWAASTDDRATTLTYRVFRDGGATAVGTVSSASTGSVGWADTGLAGGSVHTYVVSASDGPNTSAGSVASDPITVATGGGNGLFTDGFDAGLGGWTTVNNLVLDNTLSPPTGSAPSVRAAMSNQPGYASRTLAAGEPTVCATVSVRVQTLPLAGTTVNLIRLRTAANGAISRAYVTSAGKLSVRSDVSATTFTTTAALPAGAWHAVQLCTTTGTSGSVSLALDGALVKSWSTGTGTTAIGRVQIGEDGARTAVLNYDDVVATRG